MSAVRLLLLAPAVLCALALLPGEGAPLPPKDALEAGFAEVEITPVVGAGRIVYLAGFGQDRQATGVHDPLRAMAVVLRHEGRKLAIVSADLVGLFNASAERVRARLPGFDHVVVTSTHNHEGPDTLGLWGRSPFQSGVDADYLALVERRLVEAVQAADRSARPVTARIGTARAPELLHDGREPYVKHDELVALLFRDAKTGEDAGLVVQWNCHPETLESKNTLVSSDFVGYTVAAVKKKHRCPVVYLTGTVGGLMTSLHVPVRDTAGKSLADGTFEKTQRYGDLLAQVAERALDGARPIRLTPLEARSRHVYLPMDNNLYLVAWQLGVLNRDAYVWTGDGARPERAEKVEKGKRYAARTEVGLLRLGELEVATIPGEVYPELVLGKVQDPADPGADFPDAPTEPGIYAQMRGPYRMLIGLANDEIGYIIPKRQWDEKAPFCYGRPKAQYGERNSLGPETAPHLCKAFKDLVK